MLATAADGKVWMAWQAWTDGQADILLAPLDADQARAPPVKISDTRPTSGRPAIAADRSGRVHVAFDSYRRATTTSCSAPRADGTLGPAITVAGDAGVRGAAEPGRRPRGRVWVAYEERTANWGKDAVNLLDGKGSSLYRRQQGRGRPASTASASCRRPIRSSTRPTALKLMNSYPAAAIDRSGRPWLVFRHRQEAIWATTP